MIIPTDYVHFSTHHNTTEYQMRWHLKTAAIALNNTLSNIFLSIKKFPPIGCLKPANSQVLLF